jgi:OOP family OmpA-OmpF porin
MRHRLTLTLAAVALTAAAAAVVRAAAPDAGAGNDFVLHDSSTARAAHGASTSKIKATRTSAAMKFIVSDKDKGPIKGVVISLTGPTGTTYFTDETDADGYAEVLVPVGQKYDVAYLSLGRRDVAATVTVTDEPNQNVKLTLRYKRQPPPPPFVLSGVTFDTAKATIRPESFPRLDIVVEFMKYKKRARVEIAGHTDNVGSRKANHTLSEKRAQACRDYIVSKGIDRDRIEAVGFGDERPLVPNDTDEGRQKNRRIEAREL